MDEADIAQRIEQRFREQALARMRSVTPNSPSGIETCQKCGDPIPIARRQANPGVRYCVECQEETEYLTY